MTRPSEPLLIIVRPEMACYSEKILGDKEARAFRSSLSDFIHNWTGSVWLIQGPEADALERDPILNLYVHAKARFKPNPSTQRFRRQMTTKVRSIEEIIPDIKERIRHFRLAKNAPIYICGAWYSDTKDRDLNVLAKAVRGLGNKAKIVHALQNPYDAHHEEDEMIYESEAKAPLLIAVHLASACGSANSVVGPKIAAEYRDEMAIDINNHRGHFFVVDSQGFDEIGRYSTRLDQSVEQALERAKMAGCVGQRFFGDDDLTEDWEEKAADAIIAAGINSDTPVQLTGAWVDEEYDSGCVLAMQQEMVRRGFRATILSSALPVDAEEENWDEEDDGEGDLSDHLQSIFGSAPRQ